MQIGSNYNFMYRLFHEGWQQIDKCFFLFPDFYSFIYILFKKRK